MKLTLQKLSEADVTGQVRGFLEARGWRPLRMQRTVVPGQFSTCEPGTADFEFIYYLRNSKVPALSLTIWIELKKPGARAKCRCATKAPRQRCTACDQKAWRDRERSRGAVVWTQVDNIDYVIREYERVFGWLHSGEAAVGQLDLLAGVGAS
ncbi:MAG: hypothetical protein V4555_17840 [Acidobacteriota bacterium]